MSISLHDFLAHHTPLCEEAAVWFNGAMPLRVTYYLTDQAPPIQYVTSVRAVVIRGDSVLVVRDGENSFHILPGGRIEKGETPEQALYREVLEETGWHVSRWRLLGVAHFHHLAPKPADYLYPYPDFVQLVYVAGPYRFEPEARCPGEYELETGFRTIEGVGRLPMRPSQVMLLDAALRMRHD